ncbi:MAG: 16S rRNA (cytidine(1402)-2'-O)-methyltransferase [Patescibacteria group bacterium]
MLYVVATPIGNLEDITLRALRILKEVDFILCEDTRVTKKILDHYSIQKPLISYHQHSRLPKVNFIIKLLQKGKNLALVSDSGTPGISDPGNKLIKIINDKLPFIKVISIPGPSAVMAALSVSGFPTDKFIFLGFPPHKKGRSKFFQEIMESKQTVIFYESPYRIIKTLCDLQRLFAGEAGSNRCQSAERQVVVCRELTKKFETIYRGTINEVIKKISQESGVRGEFVVMVAPKKTVLV